MLGPRNTVSYTPLTYTLSPLICHYYKLSNQYAIRHSSALASFGVKGLVHMSMASLARIWVVTHLSTLRICTKHSLQHSKDRRMTPSASMHHLMLCAFSLVTRMHAYNAKHKVVCHLDLHKMESLVSARDMLRILLQM